MTGTIAVILIFSVPIIKLITTHFENKEQIKGTRVKDELELEKLKYDNFVIETEKMRLQLEQMRIDSPNDEFQKLLK
ncbi:hypothetical protein [Psychrobacillus sp. FJAT-21963]|uniref:hypothetical protein n=1 Tax=Psychrobacillus sp. FJAT-21963 TaxID=1712028 RepID=UPI0006FE8849|nr:hypothetical protein [Psychrobacillus sp. FJAT-21963]KQL35787.1 hypothetical protein AN959_07795 [Psychrobacillus sp. FJAT-21963]